MDARIIKTKQAIQSAIIDLMRNKPLSEITVSELCANAGVNRNTFYSHYNTPRSVVEEISKALLFELDKVAKQNADGLEICLSVCNFLFQNRDIFNALSSENVENAYEQIAIEQARNDAKLRAKNEQYLYNSEFIIGGCVFVLKKWLKAWKESPEKMGSFIHEQFIKYLK